MATPPTVRTSPDPRPGPPMAARTPATRAGPTPSDCTASATRDGRRTEARSVAGASAPSTAPTTMSATPPTASTSQSTRRPGNGSISAPTPIGNRSDTTQAIAPATRAATVPSTAPRTAAAARSCDGRMPRARSVGRSPAREARPADHRRREHGGRGHGRQGCEQRQRAHVRFERVLDQRGTVRAGLRADPSLGRRSVEHGVEVGLRVGVRLQVDDHEAEEVRLGDIVDEGRRCDRERLSGSPRSPAAPPRRDPGGSRPPPRGVAPRRPRRRRRAAARRVAVPSSTPCP